MSDFNPKRRRVSQLEFTSLMACVMSLAALSTDIMIPGLLHIGRDLAVVDPRDTPLIISIIFFGLAPAQLVSGPLADAIGRRPTMLLGLGIFLLGSAITVIAPSFEWLLAGRVIQGVGLAAPRTLTLAIIRDQYAGTSMARVVSNIMSVFAFVPMIAPVAGQLLLQWSGWRSIFFFVLLFGLAIWTWFYARQPETLPSGARTALSVVALAQAARRVCTNRIVMGYALCCGFMFTGFIAYMSAAAQIFQEIYKTGNAFGYLFALTGVPMVLSSYLNSRWVESLGMQRICYSALAVVITASMLLLVWPTTADDLPLVAVVLYLMTIMFAEGVLYANFNSLAMEPLSRDAGMGATLVSSLAMLVSVPIGMYCARLITDSVVPLVLALLALAIAARGTMYFVEADREWR